MHATLCYSSRYVLHSYLAPCLGAMKQWGMGLKVGEVDHENLAARLKHVRTFMEARHFLSSAQDDYLLTGVNFFYQYVASPLYDLKP